METFRKGDIVEFTKEILTVIHGEGPFEVERVEESPSQETRHPQLLTLKDGDGIVRYKHQRKEDEVRISGHWLRKVSDESNSSEAR